MAKAKSDSSGAIAPPPLIALALVALGVALGWYFLPDTELRTAQSLFIGTALAITAVPATVRILIDLGQLDTKVGQTIVTAAVFDDILSLLLLAWLTGLIAVGEPPGLIDIIILFAKMIVFFLITGIIGLYLFPWGGRLVHHLKAQEFEITNLSKFWEIMGFKLIASPEYEGVAAALM